jgi:hypothetical protein
MSKIIPQSSLKVGDMFTCCDNDLFSVRNESCREFYTFSKVASVVMLVVSIQEVNDNTSIITVLLSSGTQSGMWIIAEHTKYNSNNVELLS